MNVMSPDRSTKCTFNFWLNTNVDSNRNKKNDYVLSHFNALPDFRYFTKGLILTFQELPTITIVFIVLCSVLL